jgi:hypothetical protein
VILPTVSCICVTRHRRLFLRQAYKYFVRAAKEYAGPTEFVIADGSEEPNSFFQGNSWYVHEPEWTRDRTGSLDRIGYYHNLACERAGGDVIIKWDDDDWQSLWRIDKQARAVMSVDEGVAMSSKFFWYHLAEKRACRSRTWDTGEGTGGGILAFSRSVWKANPFPDRGVEDDVFCAEHKARGTEFVDTKDPTLFVYMRHNQNGSSLTNYAYTDDDTEEVRELMGYDVNFYDELGEVLPQQPWCHPNNAPGSKVHVMNPIQQLWARHHR